MELEAATVSSPTGLIETSRVMWESEPVTMTADEAIQAADGSQRRTSALDEAKGWLRAILVDGPVAADEAIKRARADGIAKRTLDRASKELGIAKNKAAMTDGWWWSLPPKVTKVAEDSQVSTMATVGEVGNLRTADGIAEVEL